MTKIKILKNTNNVANLFQGLFIELNIVVPLTNAIDRTSNGVSCLRVWKNHWFFSVLYSVVKLSIPNCEGTNHRRSNLYPYKIWEIFTITCWKNIWQHIFLFSWWKTACYFVPPRTTPYHPVPPRTTTYHSVLRIIKSFIFCVIFINSL